MTNKNMLLTVIILNFNTKKLTKNCLKSLALAKKQVKGEVETFVVDNGSTDGSQQMIKKHFSWANLIESKKNLGFAAGNNLAIKRAKGKYTLLLNSDTTLKKNSLKNTLSFIQNDPKIGILSARLELTNGKLDPDCHRGFPNPWASATYFLGLEKIFPKSPIFGQYHKFYMDLSKPHEIDSGAGAFALVKTNLLKKLKGLDESYFFYGEDLDLFFRVKNLGFKAVYYPKTVAIHYKGASSGIKKESKGISQATKETKIRSAKASIKAMDIFYKKFYKNKYSKATTFLILSAIKIKGFFRIAKYTLFK
jgi:hypothetical protein